MRWVIKTVIHTSESELTETVVAVQEWGWPERRGFKKTLMRKNYSLLQDSLKKASVEEGAVKWNQLSSLDQLFKYYLMLTCNGLSMTFHQSVTDPRMELLPAVVHRPPPDCGRSTVVCSVTPHLLHSCSGVSECCLLMVSFLQSVNTNGGRPAQFSLQSLLRFL